MANAFHDPRSGGELEGSGLGIFEQQLGKTLNAFGVDNEWNAQGTSVGQAARNTVRYYAPWKFGPDGHFQVPDAVKDTVESYRDMAERLGRGERPRATDGLAAFGAASLAGAPALAMERAMLRRGKAKNPNAFIEDEAPALYANADEKAGAMATIVGDVERGGRAEDGGFVAKQYYHSGPDIGRLVDENAFSADRLRPDSIYGPAAYLSAAGARSSRYGLIDPDRPPTPANGAHGGGTIPLLHRLENPLDLRGSMSTKKLHDIVQDMTAAARGTPMWMPEKYDDAMRMLEASQGKLLTRSPDEVLKNLGWAYDQRFLQQAIARQGHDGVLHIDGRDYGTPHEVAAIFPDHLQKIRSPRAEFRDLEANHFLAANAAPLPPLSHDPREAANAP